ncbi:MAG: response regulator [Spirochaetales bacterium]|nr:response regulator [Spirochaetales bacterium]
MTAARVLIVEDEVIVSTDLSRKLDKMGYTVTGCVRYGEKALEAARAGEPDIVLMDVHLKGEMDGTEAAEQIVGQLDLPVIFMTAFSDEETIARAKKSGPYSYLTKPIRLEELKINLEMALYKVNTDRKLKEHELFFRTIVDHTYDWETWVGAEGELIYTSPSCRRMTGYGKEQFEADPDLIYSIMVPSGGKDPVPEFKAHRHDKNQKMTMEFCLKKADGSEIWVEHICQPVFSFEGEFLGRRASNRDITGRKAAEEAREKLIAELQDAMDSIKTLNGLLPICSHCKKIRDDEGYWNQVETYVSKYTGAEFTHGLCPDCAKELYPKYFPGKNNSGDPEV